MKRSAQELYTFSRQLGFSKCSLSYPFSFQVTRRLIISVAPTAAGEPSIAASRPDLHRKLPLFSFAHDGIRPPS
jgi:hypothetical protein